MNQAGIDRYLQSVGKILRATENIETEWQGKLPLVEELSNAKASLKDIRKYEDNIHEVLGHGVVILEQLCSKLERVKNPLKVNGLNRKMVVAFGNFVDDSEEVHAVIHHNLGNIDSKELLEANRKREQHLELVRKNFEAIRGKLGVVTK